MSVVSPSTSVVTFNWNKFYSQRTNCLNSFLKITDLNHTMSMHIGYPWIENGGTKKVSLGNGN